MKAIIYTSGIAIVLAIMGFSLRDSKSDKKSVALPENGFVIMELFTSQGCSSCPDADAVLGKFADENNANIIPLSFHVDYWNYIGWNDPYSKREYSERQRQYAQNLGASTYTPQLIINGKYEMVGSNEKPIRETVERELKTNTEAKVDIISAIAKDGHLTVRYNCHTGKYFVNIALVKKKAVTNVGRGENSGRKLTNYNIVTDFISKQSTANTGEVSFAFDNNKVHSEYSVIAYVQDKAAGKILAASKNEIQ